MGEPFQFDYVGYLRNMVFLIILMGILAYILVKLKGGKVQIPGLARLKLPKVGSTTNQQIRVLERNMLDGRKNLYLVQVFENQYWLIGTTDTQITSLGQVKPPYYTDGGADEDSTKAFAEYMEDHETETTD
jgi:flagellar biogenesis protein FliO